MDKINNIGVSVIICCYNSTSRLKTTLDYIAKQKVSNEIDWELIIVNNKSTDNTEFIARQLTQNLCPHIQTFIVNQPTAGLSFAREKGIETAKYEFLLFCDDDNWLDPNYVQKAFEIMNSNENIGALGGWGEPEFEESPPNWFLETGIQYATGKQALESGEVAKKSSYVYGAGAVYRKSIFSKLYENNIKFYLTGRNGNQLLCSEDVEMGYWIALLGYKIWFSVELKFKHQIEKKRLTWKYVLKNAYGHGCSKAFLRPYSKILFHDNYSLIKDGFQFLKDIFSIYKYRNDDKTRRLCYINLYQRMGEIKSYVVSFQKIKNQSNDISQKIATLNLN